MSSGPSVATGVCRPPSEGMGGFFSPLSYFPPSREVVPPSSFLATSAPSARGRSMTIDVKDLKMRKNEPQKRATNAEKCAKTRNATMNSKCNNAQKCGKIGGPTKLGAVTIPTLALVGLQVQPTNASVGVVCSPPRKIEPLNPGLKTRKSRKGRRGSGIDKPRYKRGADNLVTDERR